MKTGVVDKAKQVELLLTDCDGVLTDAGVYYSEAGEQLKRFSIRDGMGVERLRELVSVETGIISGERSMALRRRAEKLSIEEYHLGIKNKAITLESIASRRGLPLHAIAYIGDDVNDLEVFSIVGLTACPNDSMQRVREAVDLVCDQKGGNGAFREFAEFIIEAKTDVRTTTIQT